MSKLDKIVNSEYNVAYHEMSSEQERKLWVTLQPQVKQQIKDLFIEILDTTDVQGPVHPQTNIWYKDLKKKVEDL